MGLCFQAKHTLFAKAHMHGLHWWCHPAISSSVTLFSCLQSFPASGSFPISRLFAWGNQSIGDSASASVLPMSSQSWFPLRFLGLISLLSKGVSRCNGHEFGQTLGDGDGQGSLACCSPWDDKESGTTKQLNNNALINVGSNRKDGFQQTSWKLTNQWKL